MAKYKVLKGIHYEGGVKYKTGQTLTSYHDLVKLFPNKFHLIETASFQSPPPGDSGAGQGNDGGSGSPDPLERYGTDTTSKFIPEDKECELKVYQTKDKKGKDVYNVIDSDRPDAPLNKTALTESKVSEFLKKYLED